MQINRTWAVPAFAAAALATVTTAANAHTGLPGHTHGLVDGFSHPLLGSDHLAAMVAVGLWAMALGGRAIWAVPSAFVGLLGVGGVLGMTGIDLPGVETVITASVIVLGLLVAFNVRIPTLPAAAIVGLFAIFHGHAHGAEMPDAAQPLLYALGFMAATALLHGVGLAAGYVLLRRLSPVTNRILGAMIAAAGAMLAIS